MSKVYNCPDCDMNLLDCSDCPRVYAHNKRNTDIDVDWSKFNINTYSNVPKACEHCATHPSNGGDGICWCVLGSYHITC